MSSDTDVPIYMDHAATTPVDPAVAAAMLPYLTDPRLCGNASSLHSFGRLARNAVDQAREQVADLIGAQFSEVFFTSSGTEADNLALVGALRAAAPHRRRLVISSIEHHAVLHTARALTDEGVEVYEAPVDAEGFVLLNALRELITPDTALVSVMHANNEIGTIQPVERISEQVHAVGALYHVDAVQSAPAIDVDVKRIGCDLLSLASHKIYGPKGAGALYIRGGVAVAPLLHGGAQERGKRPGTEDVAAIVGFGAAAALTKRRKASEAARLQPLRDRLITRLAAAGARLNGPREARLPNNVNVSVEGISGQMLLVNLDRRGVAASSGSACSSGSLEPSHVLKAIGLSDDLAASGVRFSLGHATTEAEIDQVADIFCDLVRRLRRS